MNRYQSVFIASLILIFLASAAFAYIGELKVYEKQKEISKLIEEIEKAETEAKVQELKVEKVTEESMVNRSIEEELKPDSCLKCHEKEHLYDFHYPEKILKIARKKGIAPRLCNDCHGSSLAMVVHLQAIKEKRISCEACHIINNSDFVVVKKPENKILICEVCHASGNYIKIHIDGAILENAPIDKKWIKNRSGKTCLLCHNKAAYGITVKELHEKLAKKAGKI